jgi:hypothetical protein
VVKIKRDCALLERCKFLLSIGFRKFDVVVNFVSVIMKSKVVISQTLILFSKNRWIFFLNVKQSNAPFDLGFMSISWEHYALKIVITYKTLWGSLKKKCVPMDGLWLRKRWGWGGDASWGKDVPQGKGGPVKGIRLGKGCGMKRRRSSGRRCDLGEMGPKIRCSLGKR